MITFFTTGKPFTGHNGVIQRNALKSWTVATPDAEVILFGDEEGAAETARELGIRHVAQVQRTPQGPKVLRSFFDAAQRMATHPVVCYVNCDIILLDDFSPAAALARESRQQFLMVGRRWDTDQRDPVPFAVPDWRKRLRENAMGQGKQLGGGWIDYFCFPRGLYLDQLPELVIGRVHWDQWLVWKAQQLGATVLDASSAVMAIHQNHDYGYHPAGKTGVWTDELSQANYRLAGGRWHFRTIDDATHVIDASGFHANSAQLKRSAQRNLRVTKEAIWSSVLQWTRPIRHAIGLRQSGK